MRNLVCVCVQPGSIVSQAEFHGDGILVSECRYMYMCYHGWACRIYERHPWCWTIPLEGCSYWCFCLHHRSFIPLPSALHTVFPQMFSVEEKASKSPWEGTLGFMQVWPQSGRPGSGMLLAGVQALPLLSISSSSLALGKFLLNWKNSRSVLPLLLHRIAGVQVLIACYT